MVEDRSLRNGSFNVVARAGQSVTDADAHSWADYGAAKTELERLSSQNPNLTFFLVELVGKAKSEMATKLNIQMV